MNLLDTAIARLDGTETTVGRLLKGQHALVVNVASRCGLTPQYAMLEELHERYAARGFTVLGVPCNQFGGQEPGTADEIAEFCSATYGISFPMTEKVDVNGASRHPLYVQLVTTPNTDGRVGDVEWNFEKFLVDRDGTVVTRFGPRIEPLDERVVAAVETLLDAQSSEAQTTG